MLEIAGPQQLPLRELIRVALAAQQVRRAVLVDPQATYFGATLSERSLVADAGAQLGKLSYRDWLAQHSGQRELTLAQ